MKHVALTLLGAILLTARPLPAETVQPVKAAVIRSQGTMFLGMTFWPELNSGWSDFGEVPVNIDYTSLAGYGWGLPEIRATGADVLVFSVPGFLSYSALEIAAVKQYVEEGHGLVITYDDFRDERRVLAPLVGLSERIYLGTGMAVDPWQFELSAAGHDLFARLDQPYVSGVRASASPWPYDWQLDKGLVLANKYTAGSPLQPGIIARETDSYRGLYFSHYIENKSGGANQQDMQVFYNGLLWASAPEPGTAFLWLGGTILIVHRRLKRRV